VDLQIRTILSSKKTGEQQEQKKTRKLAWAKRKSVGSGDPHSPSFVRGIFKGGSRGKLTKLRRGEEQRGMRKFRQQRETKLT